MQCYDERFCQSLVGTSDDAAITILGSPSKVETIANTTSYTWHSDKSYTSTYVNPAQETHWKDDKGRHHSTYQPAEVVENFHDRRATITLMSQNGRIVNYRSSYTGDMCNTLIPKQYIQQYIAEDKAAKAAR